MGNASTFKGTIAVVVIYIVAVVGILAAILMAPTGVGAFFAVDAVAFTVTLVTGMVLLSAYLAYQVINYDASLQFVPVPPLACPDFYSLTIDSTQTDPDRAMSCVANPNVYKTPTTYRRDGSGANVDASVLEALGDDTSNATTMSATDLRTKNVTCAKLFPSILVKNETDSYSLRKSFAQACAVPWTDNAGNFAVLDAQMMQL